MTPNQIYKEVTNCQLQWTKLHKWMNPYLSKYLNPVKVHKKTSPAHWIGLECRSDRLGRGSRRRPQVTGSAGWSLSRKNSPPSAAPILHIWKPDHLEATRSSRRWWCHRAGRLQQEARAALSHAHVCVIRQVLVWSLLQEPGRRPCMFPHANTPAVKWKCTYFKQQNVHDTVWMHLRKKRCSDRSGPKAFLYLLWLNICYQP